VQNDLGANVRQGELGGDRCRRRERDAKVLASSRGNGSFISRRQALHRGLGHDDEDGFIFLLVSRAKDFVKCGSQRISCKQLEQQLLECEDLLETAVIGGPDDVLGEAVKAFVVLRRGLVGAEERLRSFRKKRFPP
jgi:acyl-coenzyme A synthetase/AMP-(fatty) acid ligase